MNVLILTPDAVGSTFLQRLITIYMQFNQSDKPVINLHELTNGIVKYHSPDFNRELLGKPNRIKQPWGYHQSLKEIVELLDSVDHYKTSRLAQYHIRQRQDPLKDQIPFYQYLNKNFFVISCRRSNVFEHAVSWCLSKITNKLNVYSTVEKLQSYGQLYANPIDLDLNSFIDCCENYHEFETWSRNYFDVAAYWDYDTDLPRAEEWVLNLPIFAGHKQLLGWSEVFNQSFADWNRCHRILSDIGSIDQAQLGLSYQEKQATTLPVRVDHVDQSLVPFMPAESREFVEKNIFTYQQCQKTLQQMTNLGILVSPIPIKKQTFKEKQRIVRNFKDIVDAYNNWNIYGYPEVTDEYCQAAVEKEQNFWSTNQPNKLIT